MYQEGFGVNERYRNGPDTAQSTFCQFLCYTRVNSVFCLLGERSYERLVHRKLRLGGALILKPNFYLMGAGGNLCIERISNHCILLIPIKWSAKFSIYFCGLGTKV